MIIRSNKSLKGYSDTKVEEKPAVVKEENKSLDNEVIHRSKKRKITSTPIAVEEPIVVEEKTEDEDLSKWLEEHTED